MNILNNTYQAKKELALLKKALKAFEAGTGLHIATEDFQIRQDNEQKDAVLQVMLPGGVQKTFYAEIKTTVTLATFGQIAEKIRRHDEQTILVAPYINPKQAEKLGMGSVTPASVPATFAV